MDSLSMYFDFCNKNRKTQKKITNLRLLVNCIYSELLPTTCVSIEKSPFLVETFKLCSCLKNGLQLCEIDSKISLLDAFVVINGLKSFTDNQDIKSIKIPEGVKYDKELFENVTIQKKERILLFLGFISDYFETINGASTNIDNTDDMDHKLDPHPVKNEEFICSKKDRAINIQRWHDELSSVNLGLKELQPLISDSLKRVISFSDDITESCVLQFARMFIDLFNLINDNYDYHSDVSERSGNNDYINAVNNYRVFSESIIDYLSAYGIEEIKSAKGMSFDGSIHEPYGVSDFSPKRAVVKKSKRSGFRYNDIVVQKEKVII